MTRAYETEQCYRALVAVKDQLRQMELDALYQIDHQGFEDQKTYWKGHYAALIEARQMAEAKIAEFVEREGK